MPYFFYYSLLGSDVTTSTFDDLLSPHFCPQQASVRLSCKPDVIRQFLGVQKPLQVFRYCCFPDLNFEDLCWQLLCQCWLDIEACRNTDPAFCKRFLSNFDGHWVTKPGKWPFKMVLCDWSFLLLMSHFAGALFNMLKLKTCKWSLLYDDSLLLCDGMHKCGLCCHAVSLSVCPSVCPSRSCILTKRINISSKSHRRITTPFYFFRAKHYGSILGHQMLNICLYHVLSTVWPPSVIHSFAGMWLWQVADTRSW